MTNDMEKRLDRLEWESSALKERYEHMSDRIGEMSIRMDSQHRELLTAIGNLKDDRARQQGAAEAELRQSQRDRDRMKLISVILGVFGLLAALGWVGSTDTKAAPINNGTRYEKRNVTDP